jgi:hypothetical protein
MKFQDSTRRQGELFDTARYNHDSNYSEVQ